MDYSQQQTFKNYQYHQQMYEKLLAVGKIQLVEFREYLTSKIGINVNEVNAAEFQYKLLGMRIITTLEAKDYFAIGLIVSKIVSHDANGKIAKISEAATTDYNVNGTFLIDEYPFATHFLKIYDLVMTTKLNVPLNDDSLSLQVESIRKATVHNQN